MATHDMLRLGRAYPCTDGVEVKRHSNMIIERLKMKFLVFMHAWIQFKVHAASDGQIQYKPAHVAHV